MLNIKKLWLPVHVFKVPTWWADATVSSTSFLQSPTHLTFHTKNGYRLMLSTCISWEKKSTFQIDIYADSVIWLLFKKEKNSVYVNVNWTEHSVSEGATMIKVLPQNAGGIFTSCFTTPPSILHGLTSGHRTLKPATILRKGTVCKTDQPRTFFPRDLIGCTNNDLRQLGMWHLLLLMASACSGSPLWQCCHYSEGWVGKESIIFRNKWQCGEWWWSHPMVCWLNTSVLEGRTGVRNTTLHNSKGQVYNHVFIQSVFPTIWSQ